MLSPSRPVWTAPPRPTPFCFRSQEQAVREASTSPLTSPHLTSPILYLHSWRHGTAYPCVNVMRRIQATRRVAETGVCLSVCLSARLFICLHEQLHATPAVRRGCSEQGTAESPRCLG